MRRCTAGAVRRVIICRDLNRRRLERDMGEYWGALSSKSITEAELHEKAKANSKIQPHVLGFIAARDKAELETQGDGREVAERWPRDGREMAERQPRDSREAAERQPRDSRETAERQPRSSRAAHARRAHAH